MNNNQQVQDHYQQVAQNILNTLDEDAPCGRSSCCDEPMRASEARFLYAQESLSALPSGALTASRGCGDPVAKANLQPGEFVLDLGSGGGIDTLIAAQLVGAEGQVYGVDITPDMITLAQKNAEAAGINNVSFIQGNVDDLPLEDQSVDVVLSNCVINFCDNKLKVLQEACRVLKPNGRFVVSDIVSFKPIAGGSYKPLCTIVGCINGMQSAAEYQQLFEEAGFSQVELEPKTIYTLDVLKQKAEQKGREEFFAQIENDDAIDSASGSVIVYALKKDSNR